MTNKLHIVGCSPRSGTTLIHELITTCFDIKLFYKHEKSIFRTDRIDKGIICSKHPNEIFYLKWLLKFDSSLNIIYMLRDPRDVISSSHKNSKNRYFIDFNTWSEYEELRPALESHPRFFVIRYEELVSEPTKIQRDLIAKFPFLKQKISFNEYHLHAKSSSDSIAALNGLRPISKSSIGMWKKNMPRIKQQCIKYPSISNKLIKSGYENNNNWLKSITDTHPYNESSPLPLPTSIFTYKIKFRVFRKVVVYLLHNVYKNLIR